MSQGENASQRKRLRQLPHMFKKEKAGASPRPEGETIQRKIVHSKAVKDKGEESFLRYNVNT